MGRRKVLATFGDMALLDFDGAILYRDSSGGLSLDFWEVICKACGGPPGDGCRRCQADWARYARYDVRSACVAPDVRADLSWLTDSHIADMDQSLDLRQLGNGYGGWASLARADDARLRAMAVLAVRDYFGPDDLDDYPVRMTRTDLLRYRPFYRGAVRMARQVGGY